MQQQISSKSFRSSRLRIACRAFNAGAFRRFRKDTCGGVMVYIGLTLPVLLGFSGMAVDGSIWFANKRRIHGAASVFCDRVRC
jgi:Flp pilus assembly protein TadG